MQAPKEWSLGKCIFLADLNMFQEGIKTDKQSKANTERRIYAKEYERSQSSRVRQADLRSS